MGLLTNLLQHTAQDEAEGKTDQELIGLIRENEAGGYVQYAKHLAKHIQHDDLRDAIQARIHQQILDQTSGGLR
jgi:hypothetical protein